MIAVLAALFAASPWTMSAKPIELPSPEKVMARVAACGMKPPRAAMRNEQGMGGEDVVRIGSGSTINARQRACLARVSADMTTFIFFDDPDEQRAFFMLETRRQAKSEPREARKRLRQAGLLATLPRYDPARQTLESYTQSLEALCRATPGSLLEPFGPNLDKPSLFTPKRAGLDFSPQSGERLLCVQDAITASNLADHGIRFGFVGNEMAEEPVAAK